MLRSWRCLWSASARLPATRRLCTAIPEQEYDVIVSGGGMVGLAMAAALCTDPVLRDYRVTLLEAGPAPPPAAALPAEFSNRVCALSPATRRLLERLGAWERLERYSTTQHMQVWESRSDAMIRFENLERPEDLAYIVENEVITRALSAALAAAGGEVAYDAAVEEIALPPAGAAPGEDAVRLRLADGRRLSCSLLVGADGVGSAVRRAMGVRTLGWSYGQRGVVATLCLADADLANNVAWQRFLPTGPLALLPLSDTRSSLVWSTSDAEARRLLALSDDDFVDALNRSLWDEHEAAPAVQWAADAARGLLGALGLRAPSGPLQLPPSVAGVVPGSRAAFPLALQHAEAYTARRAVLVGDAARRVHPLAGQGANLGFGDVTALAAALAAAASCGADLGARRHLAEYETVRQRASAALLTLTDGLQRLYGTEALPAVLLRSVGLQVCDAVPQVRRFLMDRARA
ncbi:ubiquinone biosynthesis monooxygenase COQ6, mitochondrial-like [Pollicipes pollicipes]|uniref:ubiquinone biosynthesis monooxygenase COQ6, mitochondrial-like n=1 Tax=Pollicipes pollicipes TaxID=41117 RepID=UPI001884B5E1|nr:ubiquinone biosynthesis monooxygenase COQ6, mitochondrial-like [Pollicipes pollicipes]XP_037087119.1 ubiquinone biosynthesis monooxygenase COQ6, mitochondrial-like [Pollicipes pollicipes]